MTVRDMQRSISPGSTEYGDRQTLEQGLSDVGGAGAGAGAPASPTPALPDRGNPLSDLISGAVKPSGDQPLTSGLSVGPGDGSAGPETPNDLEWKLQSLVKYASSPVLRRLAIDKLRRMQKARS